MGDQDHIGENLHAYRQAVRVHGAHHLRALRVQHPDRQVEQGRPPVSGHRKVRGYRSPPGDDEQRPGVSLVDCSIGVCFSWTLLEFIVQSQTCARTILP